MWHPNISIFKDRITSNMLYVFAFLGFLWITLLSAVIIPSEPAIFPSALDGAGLTNQSMVTNDLRFQYTGPAFAQEEVQCDGANYGTNLDARSCGDALRHIDHYDTRPTTFGQRGSVPPSEQPLPLRRSSGELSNQSHVGRYLHWENNLMRR